MRVVVAVGDLPFLDGVESRLDERDVRERRGLEEVEHRLGVAAAGLVAADGVDDRQLPGHGGCHDRRVHERRVGVEVLPRFERHRGALAAGIRRGADQRLRREHEEPVHEADVLGVHRQRAQYRGCLVGAVVRVEHTRSHHRLGIGVRRELQNQVAFLRHRHRDRVPRSRRDAQRRSVAVHGPADLRVRIAVLADDCELGVVAGGRLGQSHSHVGDVADVGQRPDLGLPWLELQLRLELAVDRELDVALILGQVGVLGDLLGRTVERQQVRRDELCLAAVVVR